MPIVIPASATPTLADFVARVRTDLFDAGQRAGEQPRWLDSDLVRALDRANDTYSGVAPLLKELLMSTIPQSRLYASPSDAWWIDQVEYPHGLWPKRYQPFLERRSPLIPPPPADTGTVRLVAGGALSAGWYQWAITYVVPGGGETEPTVLAGPVTASAGQAAQLSDLPLGPYGVTDRAIYRTRVGSSGPYWRVGSVGDNQGTSYLDTLSDAQLVLPAPTSNTTEGIAQFELGISDALLPADASGYLQVRYASKHELAANGTTIPERHWDLITLGGAMYAVMAYLVPTADNFEYVDGQFRDRVDDTKVPLAWLAIGQDMNARFKARLAQIESEANAGVAAVASWGDKPLRWDRL
jgi:hypothetical protein